MPNTRPRLLIKARPMPKGTAFALGKAQMELEPLFASEMHQRVMGAAAPSQWHLATVPDEDVHIWDLCHRMQSGGFGFAGAPTVEYVEPDIEQGWPYDSPERLAVKGFQAASAVNACAHPDPPDPRFPAPSPFDWRWYQGSFFSGLADARTAIGNPENRITIAHLDTGYKKGHKLLPQFLDESAAKSFVEDDQDPNSAVDPGISGFGRNPGHGTGTLCLLAGNIYDGSPHGDPKDLVGGAPFARVIPIRVASSVVLFTNSSIARGIEYAISQNVHVLSMSMGGVPSQVWADIVNRAYEAGITMVTAAGNNFGPGPLRVPRFIVYPARFGRVIAACGVMHDGKPYGPFADPRRMAGSFGPDSKMDTAMAAFTPNASWADYDCDLLVRYDGQGTSSATPQIAAAAACWIQKHRDAIEKLPEKWMRVEAVRKALFGSADDRDRKHFGRGKVRAAKALEIGVDGNYTRQPEDRISVPILGPISNVIFGAAKGTVRSQMLRVEAAQIFARSGEIQRILAASDVDPDRPPSSLSPALRHQIADAVISDPTASKILKEALSGTVRAEKPMIAPGAAIAPLPAESPEIPAPLTRKLRVFAFDPVLGLRVDTESLNEATLEIPWEPNLQPGPVGEYLEVVDVDPSSGSCYAPVDLNHPHLLASNGHAPSEGVPQFHQQMVYAVAMTTIQRFEHALGRKAFWAPHNVPPARKGDRYRSFHVQRLRIYPHALREANAFYSPPKNALLFGYFQANRRASGDNLPGGLVFTCLSHDVVAHETTHALVDGLHRYYQIQSNPDIAAFHEAFADIVALFQHFSMPTALRHTIAKTRGDLKNDNLLADLAQQFGQASNGSRALRSALKDKPGPDDYANATEAHDRGAVLLAAVFDAFLQIYDARVADLKRLATGGTGVLPQGDISVDLVNRLAQEASVAASHVLTTCIRALDYCPPVDLTFGDYLRALITADLDVEPEDALNYRTAFISGFRKRGIYPNGVRTLSEESLRWQPPRIEVPPAQIRNMLSGLQISWNLSTNRQQAQEASEENGQKLWNWLKKLKPEDALNLGRDLGIYLTEDAVKQDTAAGRLVNTRIANTGGVPTIEIHSVRPARRIGRGGQQVTDLVVEAVQRCYYAENNVETRHRGGCTILIDLEMERIRYVIRKRVGNVTRLNEERKFLGMAAENSQAYFDTSGNREPFAMLHRGI